MDRFNRKIVIFFVVVNYMSIVSLWIIASSRKKYIVRKFIDYMWKGFHMELKSARIGQLPFQI